MLRERRYEKHEKQQIVGIIVAWIVDGSQVAVNCNYNCGRDAIFYERAGRHR